ncbi:MAG: ABC transporter substrate-binding protein [Desulfobacteraceae bacterium]|nr:ABC transporter substrate-binding protein [Desulfobacteraceae bacterium]
MVASRRLKTRRLCQSMRAGALLLMALLWLFGCDENAQREGMKTAAQKPQQGGVYRIPLLNNPKSLDPVQAEDQYSAAVVYQIFDGLVRFGPDLLIVPALAENWQIEENGSAYRFFLRGNALFHNGKPVTSQDVLFSFSRLIRAEPPPSILQHMLRIAGARAFRDGSAERLEGVEIVGPREFVVRLEGPYAPFLAILGMYQTKIVPRDEGMEKGEAFSRSPVGSGPFCFESWEDNKSVRLKRFTGYYLGAPLLDEIRYVIYSGGKIDEALADFQARKLEELPALGKIRKRLASDGGAKLIHRYTPSLLFYGVNCEHPVLRQLALRRALSLAIDRERLAATVYEGQFEPARSILPPGILGYSPEDRGVRDDIEAARAELKAAGLENADLTLEVVSAVDSPIAKAEFEFIARCWEKLGIKINIKYILNWAEFEGYIASPSVQIYRYAWFVDIPDPDNIMYSLFGSDSTVNYMRFRNPGVDDLLRAGRGSVQPVERAGIYRKITEKVVRESPAIPLVHLSTDQAYQSNVQGIQLNALAIYRDLNEAWLSAEPGK